MRPVRMTARLVCLLSLALSTLAGCGGDDDTVTPDAPPRPDARTDGAGGPDGPIISPDGPPAPDAPPTPDAPPMADAPPVGDIQMARNAADGATSVPIAGAFVTYLKPAVGTDPAGFFIQKVQAGPALFVAVDPATLAPAPAVGDTVSFTVTAMGTAGMLRQATAVSGWTRDATGGSVAALIQDLSAAADLTTNVGAYESELVRLVGTVAGPFGFGGTGHQSAQLATAGITGDTNFNFRVPDALRDALDLAQTCAVTINGTPLWRYNAQTQPSAWVAADVTVTSCPAPRVTAATAASATSVLVTFDRRIDPASVVAGGSQFTFTGGLTASAAAVSGTNPRQVVVTTGMHTGGMAYTVTVAASVLDTRGAGVDAAANTAMFNGYVTLAVVRINELNARVTSPGTCDLIELRAVSGGSLQGYQLYERDASVLTFGALTVATNDLIVVHFGPAACNPGASGNETSVVDQYPVAGGTAANYDTAWDWYSTDAGLTDTDNVFTLYDNLGVIMDAVFASDDPTGTAAAATETQAAAVAAAGQWTMVGGGVPAGGFVDANFNAHAVQDLNATGMTATGDSIRRINNGDTNALADWAQGNSTFGMLNPGQ